MNKRFSSLFLVFIIFIGFSTATLTKLGRLLDSLEEDDDRDQTQRDYSRCPLCDSSVYSYCSYKLLHDSCCCQGQYGYRTPPSCQYIDCRFIYANSCAEHDLINRCCCDDYRRKY